MLSQGTRVVTMPVWSYVSVATPNMASVRYLCATAPRVCICAHRRVCVWVDVVAEVRSCKCVCAYVFVVCMRVSSAGNKAEL